MYLSKRKGIYYVFYRKSDGKKTCKSTGSRFKKEALAYLKDFEQKLFEQKKRKKILLSEFKKEYLFFIGKTHTDKSISAATQSFKQLQKYLKKDIYLFDITNRDAEDFILTRYQKAKYASSLYYRNLKRAFNVAVNWKYIDTNPFLTINFPTIPRNTPAYLTEEQLQKILQFEQDLTIRIFYKTAFYTGARLSELINLNWQDVVVDKKELLIRNKESFTVKNKKERSIPISDKLYDDLLMLKEKSMERRSGLLFEMRGRAFNSSYLSRRFKKIIRALGFNESIHFHSLRHSFCSFLVSRGANINVIKALAGHSSISVTDRYSHVNSDYKVETIKLFE